MVFAAECGGDGLLGSSGSTPLDHVMNLNPDAEFMVRLHRRRCGPLTAHNYLRLYLAQIRAKLEPDPVRPRYFITEARMG